ncbi:MAG TPA: MBL fold metallo-hydrolase [Vicinamibacterales bacterium]|nr:MBL fold metallo-hydrolase [Vicinamibacterales bacterium]
MTSRCRAATTKWLWTALAAASCLAAGGSTVAPEPPPTRLIMLGTGNPAANPDRFGPSAVVLVGDRPYLVDCGVGVVRRWAAAIRDNHLPLQVWDLRIAFVTHLHSDHTLGYPDLIFTPWTLQGDSRRGPQPPPAPLVVYGPNGLRAMTRHLLAAYADDVRIRTGAGGEQAGKHGPVVDVHEIDAGVVFHDDRVTVTAFRVPHGTWPQAFGFRFDTPDKTIVFSGDSAFSPAIARQCRGCDILVHEGGITGDTSAYYRAFHTTAEDLATIARQAHPKLLILYHQRDGNEAGLRVIRSRYGGAVVVAHDLQVFE